MGALSTSMRRGAALAPGGSGDGAAMSIRRPGDVLGGPCMGVHSGIWAGVACTRVGGVHTHRHRFLFRQFGRMGKAGKRQRKFVQKGGLQAAIKHRRTAQKVRRGKAAQAERGEARGGRTALHGAPKFSACSPSGPAALAWMPPDTVDTHAYAAKPPGSRQQRRRPAAAAATACSRWCGPRPPALLPQPASGRAARSRARMRGSRASRARLWRT